MPTKNLRISVRKQSGFKHFGHALGKVIYNTSVIRQKGKSQKGCLKKTKHAKFSEKQTFLTP